MKREELLFVSGVIIGIIFQWNNTLCALFIGVLVGYHMNNHDDGGKKRITNNKKNEVEKQQSITDSIYNMSCQAYDVIKTKI